MARVSPFAVRIDGMRELQSEMRRLAPAIHREFYKEMRGIAGDVVAEVRDEMPEQSGAAKRSVKPSFTGGVVAVRAGGSDVPYYPWLDFGGTLPASGGRTNSQKRPFFKEGRWIYPTIARRRADIYRRAVAAVERAKKAAHFS